MAPSEIIDGLYVGDILDVQQGDTSDFDTVITVCQDNVLENVGSDNYHHFPLSDGPPPENAHNPGECSYELFENAVDEALVHVRKGNNTLVHCHAGQSRSVCVATCVVAVVEDTSWDPAYQKVRAARGNTNPSEEIRYFGTKYVTNHRMQRFE